MSAGVGVGAVGRAATCTFCTGSAWPALSYRLARTIRYDVVIGLEGMAAEWAGAPACSGAACLREPDASFVVSAHAITIQWYPNSEYPYFIKLGGGVAAHRARYTRGVPSEADTAVRRTVTIVSATPKIGVGVERRVSPQVALTLHVDAVRAVRGRMSIGDASLSPFLVYFGAGLVWYR